MHLCFLVLFFLFFPVLLKASPFPNVLSTQDHLRSQSLEGRATRPTTTPGPDLFSHISSRSPNIFQTPQAHEHCPSPLTTRTVVNKVEVVQLASILKADTSSPPPVPAEHAKTAMKIQESEPDFSLGEIDPEIAESLEGYDRPKGGSTTILFEVDDAPHVASSSSDGEGRSTTILPHEALQVPDGLVTFPVAVPASNNFVVNTPSLSPLDTKGSEVVLRIQGREPYLYPTLSDSDQANRGDTEWSPNGDKRYPHNHDRYKLVGLTTTIAVGGLSLHVSPSSRGGGRSIAIPYGMPFAGRMAGGGTRAQIYGTSQYGSGYPGNSTPSVSGRGFPFNYYPISYITNKSFAGHGNLSGDSSNSPFTNEYGRPDNTSRPGGVLSTATFNSKSGNSLFQLLADESTVLSLILSIQTSCASLLSNLTSTAVPYDGKPGPEEAVQYYRGSSIALALDKYSSSLSTFSTNSSLPAGTSTFSPAGTDFELLECLNTTIGRRAPLVQAEVGMDEIRIELYVFFFALTFGVGIAIMLRFLVEVGPKLWFVATIASVTLGTLSLYISGVDLSSLFYQPH